MPLLKRSFPFRLATTSYILPAEIVPNIRYLGQYFDEIELVLFESGRESNLPTPGDIREMARLASDLDLTYNVHLPADLFFGDPDPRFAAKILRNGFLILRKNSSPCPHLLYFASGQQEGR